MQNDLQQRVLFTRMLRRLLAVKPAETPEGNRWGCIAPIACGIVAEIFDMHPNQLLRAEFWKTYGAVKAGPGEQTPSLNVERR